MRMATAVVGVWMHLHSHLQIKDMLITGVAVQEVVNLEMWLVVPSLEVQLVVPRLEMVVVQSLEVALEITSQEDIQAQSQVAVEVMEILNLVVVVVAEEADHVLPALQHNLTPLQHCFSQP